MEDKQELYHVAVCRKLEWKSSWTEVADLNALRRSAGLLLQREQTRAALAAGGYAGSPNSGVTNTETWNGSAWTEVG